MRLASVGALVLRAQRTPRAPAMSSAATPTPIEDGIRSKLSELLKPVSLEIVKCVRRARSGPAERLATRTCTRGTQRCAITADRRRISR